MLHFYRAIATSLEMGDHFLCDIAITIANRFRSMEKVHLGGHGPGKTGNLIFNFSRQGKHKEFKEFKKNAGNLDKAGKFLGLSYRLTGGGGHLENKICSFLHVKKL